MGRKKIWLLSLFFLAGVLIVQLSTQPIIVSADLFYTFEHDPIFWEDWESSGAYNWNQQNSTLQVQAISTGSPDEATINKGFETEDDDDSLEMDYLYRYKNKTSTTPTTWFDTDFPYRKSHTITGSSVAGTQTNYQIRLITNYGSGSDSGNIIYLNSLSQPDFDDVRFVKSDHITEFDYWRQAYIASSTATFWVEVDSIAGSGATTEIFLYWGNASASTLSNGTNTFLLYDDFNDGKIDWNKWVWQNGTYGGVPVENDGLLMLNDTTDRTLVSSLATYSPNVAVHGEIYFRDYRSFGFVEYTPVWNDDIATISDYGTTERSSTADEGSQTNELYAQSELTWQIMSAKWFSSSRVGFEVNYASATNHTVDIPDGTPTIPVFFYTYHGDANELLHLNWTIVCKVVYSEPRSTATGALTTYGGGAGATYGYMRINYSTIAATQELGLYHNASLLWIEYYNWSSQQSFAYFDITALNFNYESYMTVSWEVDAYTRTASLEVTLQNNTEIIDTFVYVDFNPARAESVTVGAYADCGGVTYANATVELVWIEAPFSDVTFIRDWQTVNFDLDDSPYFIHTTTVQWENATVKILPFQGFKALWNCSLAGVDKPFLDFEWYSRNGTYQGGFRFKCEKTTPYQYTFWTSPDGNTWTSQRVFRTDAWTVAIALWIDEGGRAYAYIQEDPESHTFCDFIVLDITDFVDMESWGIQFSHCLEETTGGSNVFSALKEVEFFAGERIGISQPRFGGMVWLWNPLLFFFHWLATVFFQVGQWLAAALAPVVTAVGTFLRPFIEGVTGAVTGLVVWFSDQLDTLLDIFGVLGSIVVDIVNYLIANFIVPMVAGLVDWLINSFMTLFFYAVALSTGVLDFILRAVSNWFWGDATILPTLLVGANLFIFETIRGVGYFLISGNIFAIGFYLLGMLSGFSSPIGYVTIGLGTIPDFIMLALFWTVTYAPVLFFIYITMTLLNVLMAFVQGNFDFQAFAPLWALFLFFWRLAEYGLTVIRTILNLIWSLITAIMEIIPF